jgi:ABC-type microcin C transport system duplicated ATPase subunit YejF
MPIASQQETSALKPVDMSQPPLLRVENVTKHFPIKRGLLSTTVGHVQAVTNVSFELRRGETIGPGRRIGAKTTMAQHSA